MYIFIHNLWKEVNVLLNDAFNIWLYGVKTTCGALARMRNN